MKLKCLHGYFKFSELRAGEVSDFMSLYGLSIERSRDHFTFSDLVDAPKYSIEGGKFLGCPTTKTFEGEPWEVMRENGIVYDFANGLVVPISTITQPVKIQACGNFYFAPGIILPGSIMEDGSRVTDYAAFFLFDRMGFKYSEVDSE